MLHERPALGLSYRFHPNPDLGLLEGYPDGTRRHSACPERHKAEGAHLGLARLFLPAPSQRSAAMTLFRAEALAHLSSIFIWVDMWANSQFEEHVSPVDADVWGDVK